MYKVLAKVLANRPRKVKNSIIDKEDSLLVKLDFEKAYDSMDHDFLNSMLEGMGFGRKWRIWIRECISSPLMSVLVNVIPTPQFSVQRCLRQGDHLSPFHFNIAVDGLNCLLLQATSLDLISGENFNDNSIHITHLQFVDDTILFLKPKVEYLLNAKRILRCFELASGLKVNFHKSCMVRVGRAIFNDQTGWAFLFKCKKASLPIPFLGFPLGGRPGAKSF
ncbi:hypothetical protein Ddye_025536 [Dipteronia dyeriana]|uniref:Reverse transcriptase domain-containing protein n=1 Tax=Dipteronia dyeriana TaxID=168575 RepID=A0AAD9WNM0_9ROSI|nr:hypothetical protein Ddye_025536 [Dipteronia dyeriana]